MTLALNLDPDKLRPLAAIKAVNVLARHGKSFHFAGRFLPREQLAACARLYSFCRYLDDLVDASPFKPDALRQLIQIQKDLKIGISLDPVVNDFLTLSNDYQISITPVEQLIQGLLSDLGDVLIEDDAQLKLYCYRVAGTVGLLMCDVLGVKDAGAHKHAIDLGIAMQLTNIARDVAEDARNKRRYLPADLVGNLTPTQIAAADVWHRTNLQAAVMHLLSEADRYYTSGEQGLAYLPWRARLAILVAARVYRAIGSELASKQYATWLGRAQVSKVKKIWIAVHACFQFCTRPRFHIKQSRHEHRLHGAIFDLPGSYQAERAKV